MNRLRYSRCAGLFGAALLALVAMIDGGLNAALAQSGEARAEMLRPEVGRAVKAADELIRGQKFQEALIVIREAEGVPDRTPLENYAIDRMRGVAAAGAGDTPTAARSLEAVLASPRTTPDERIRIVEALSVLYFKAGDYPQAAVWTSRYLEGGGTGPQMRMLRVRALYLAGDFAGTATELRPIVEADEKAGVTPQLEQVQLLASSYAKLNDGPGYDYTLEKLLAYFPAKQYWADAIRRVETKPGLAEHLALDVLRLREATDNLSSAAQYTVMAELALRIGLPGEAKRIAERGFASGVLGTGPDADLQRRLRDTAAKEAAEDEKLLVQNAKDAGAAKDGTALVNVGFALVTAGQYDRGIALMERGIERGGVNRPNAAKLHLAIGYLAAGKKDKAIQAFKTVQGSDGTADLARLWVIHAQRTSG